MKITEVIYTRGEIKPAAFGPVITPTTLTIHTQLEPGEDPISAITYFREFHRYIGRDLPERPAKGGQPTQE